MTSFQFFAANVAAADRAIACFSVTVRSSETTVPCAGRGRNQSSLPAEKEALDFTEGEDMMTAANPNALPPQALVASALRLGLGAVFVVGGVAKLQRLLNPAEAQGIIDQYVGPLGYINQTFREWLFAGPLGSVLTPWSFLTTLSAFELASGLMLVAGLMVRPLALLWALLLWSFVVSLPVVTTPGVTPEVETYMSPAELVQIRDIALSGFFFALYNLGPGAGSLDAGHFGQRPALDRNWDPLGLLLRLSLGAVFLVGGFFAGFSNITTFGMPAILLAIVGLGLVAGAGTRLFAAVAAGVLVWFLLAKIGGATSVIGYLNAVKREFALLAAAGVLAAVGGGRLFAITGVSKAMKEWRNLYLGAQRRPQADRIATQPAPLRAVKAMRG